MHGEATGDCSSVSCRDQELYQGPFTREAADVLLDWTLHDLIYDYRSRGS